MLVLNTYTPRRNAVLHIQSTVLRIYSEFHNDELLSDRAQKLRSRSVFSFPRAFVQY